ncbi:MAG TPA: DUF3597 domain-containing protein [Anaerolineales bacterium]|nr:DUF3597 domain-containing protein [Anaerolineales bacterium]
MSIFSKILEKLGLHKEQPTATGTSGSTPSQPATAAPNARPAPSARPAGSAPTSEKGIGTTTGAADRRQKDDVAVKQAPAPVPAGPTTPRAMSQVDVTKMLEQKAKGTGLNWKQSISDLLFLLDIDNSREARTELAKELGAPADVMTDSARMNTWLHKTVLRKIAENGGNIPQELLD